jgi:predicted small lipoprotein YifL
MLRRSLAAFIACTIALSTAACGIKGPLKPPPGATPPPLTGAAPGVVPPSTSDTSAVPGSPASTDAGKEKKE